MSINTTGAEAHSSAGLDIDFSNKGLLIPRVALTSTTDAITIPSPATGLMVYNTGTGGLSLAGYYYNAGTSSSPNWVHLSTTGLDGSGTATRVAFWSGTNTLSSNANLYWDNTNSRLGVGTASPAYTLDVNGIGNFSTNLRTPYFGLTNTLSSNGYGISLYGGPAAGQPTYGLMFAGTGTFGTHGYVTSDWATYFTMNDNNTRGWIFRKNVTNVASISGDGNLTVNGRIRIGNNSQTEMYSNGNRIKFRAENIDDVAQFASYGLFIPQNSNCNLYVGGGVQFNYFNNDTTKFVVKANGNVGIGATSPAHKLVVNGNVNVSKTIGWGGYSMLGYDQDGSIELGNSLSSGKTPFIDFHYGKGTSQDYNVRIINDADRRLSLDAPTVHLSGNVGIGTNSPSYRLHVVGDVYCTGTYQGSDLRFKKDIHKIDSPLSKVLSLRGVYYYWDLENPEIQNPHTNRQIGVIAQEVEKVLPELVNTDLNGYKSVDYSRMVAVLVEAIKEQERTIEEQKSMINNLNERLMKLEKLFKTR
ncbi:MAG TPA: tail fiber domain-containing protein [Paludibacteraceae bacterium]|nr:tail fiber domain-containing protein [Paludibacteraceae bacterium]